MAISQLRHVPEDIYKRAKWYHNQYEDFKRKVDAAVVPPCVAAKCPGFQLRHGLVPDAPIPKANADPSICL